MFDGGCFYYCQWLYIPVGICRELVQSAHTSLEGSHGSHLCTVAFLSKDYWWSGLSFFVCHFVQGCVTCQLYKVLTHWRIPPTNPLAFKTTLPFWNILKDLTTNLP